MEIHDGHSSHFDGVELQLTKTEQSNKLLRAITLNRQGPYYTGRAMIITLCSAVHDALEQMDMTQ